MTTDGLHRGWARHGWRLILVALTVLTLSRAYVAWRDIPADMPPPPARTSL